MQWVCFYVNIEIMPYSISTNGPTSWLVFLCHELLFGVSPSHLFLPKLLLLRSEFPHSWMGCWICWWAWTVTPQHYNTPAWALSILSLGPDAAQWSPWCCIFEFITVSFDLTSVSLGRWYCTAIGSLQTVTAATLLWRGLTDSASEKGSLSPGSLLCRLLNSASLEGFVFQPLAAGFMPSLLWDLRGQRLSLTYLVGKYHDAWDKTFGNCLKVVLKGDLLSASPFLPFLLIWAWGAWFTQ